MVMERTAWTKKQEEIDLQIKELQVIPRHMHVLICFL